MKRLIIGLSINKNAVWIMIIIRYCFNLSLALLVMKIVMKSLVSVFILLSSIANIYYYPTSIIVSLYLMSRHCKTEEK